MEPADPVLRNASTVARDTGTDAKSQQQQPVPSASSAAAFSPQTPSSATTLTAATPAALDPHSSSSSNNNNNNNNNKNNNNNNRSGGNPNLYNPSSLTPPGTGNAADDEHEHDHDHAHGAEPKKPRACESCRGLKVRCDPDPANPEGPCRRCAKAKRACVVTQPTRKRQKKTDSRVAELEKKIDALTASLQASRGSTSVGMGVGGVGVGDGGAGGGVGGWPRGQDIGGRRVEEGHGVRYPPTPTLPPPPPPPPPPPHPAGMMPAPPAVAGQKRKLDERRESGEDVGFATVARDTPSLSSSATPQPGADAGREQQAADVVEREILTMPLANELLIRYVTQMFPHLPAVVIPPGTTAADLRASKPLLFLAIMAAASSENPALQRILTKELMQVLAERIIVRGHKNLELIQALQIATIWYWPPERFEELKFYQLVHVAAVMAIEIGLGRKRSAKGGFRKHIAYVWRDHPMRKPALPDPTTFEARRAWLTCYFMATNTSMALHRPNLIRWTPFINECMDLLKSSPEAAPTDKYLCHLVWTHRLAEEVGIQFSMDDPPSTPDLAETRTQHVLNWFERELERYRTAIPKEMQQPSLMLGFEVINLYMHEIATHSDTGDDSNPNVNDMLLRSDAPLPLAHVRALSACTKAIDGIFEVFLSLDVQTIRCLPVFNFVRVAYAVVVLIKMYFAASSPKSELGKYIPKDDMKVEQHLEDLLEKFRATADKDRSRPAGKFLVVLVMIRTWFHKQKQSQSGGSNQGSGAAATDTQLPPFPFPGSGERDTPTPVPQQRPQQQDYSTSTPLQLLSEIATHNSAAASGPGTSSSRPSTSADFTQTTASASPWLSKPSFAYDPITNTTAPVPQSSQQQQTATTTETTSSTGAPAQSPNATFPPGSDFDYDYAAFSANGFAEAMEYTLGGFTDADMGFGYWLGQDFQLPSISASASASASASGGPPSGSSGSAPWFPPPPPPPPPNMGVGLDSLGVAARSPPAAPAPPTLPAPPGLGGHARHSGAGVGGGAYGF
ncbi:uncharacterized protein B0T15DRAFT_426320 [Chaetomium strumarium]|uniref:Zn(2)-C6 fungal-type domain-containing protein n=1 Tax=Chaetomium strumarium TaxID=1170767 RepID=A0AAJ0M6H2_9PEZI|nr:hypothetical protein B0T15DRAFT_426320 [Chaetomium strumarium]